MPGTFLRRYPFSYYLVGAIFLILAIAVAGLIGISYFSTEQTLGDNARSVELQTENNLVAVFTTKEEGIRVYDESLNHRLEESFPLFLAEYQRAGGDPAAMDLEKVKTEIGGDMELYVIDANATIIRTTYLPELGLDFTDFAPYFASYLESIRISDGFHPDRVVSEASSGSMKKFGYMPTPDHRYILELGLQVTEPDIGNFRYMDEDLIQQVERSNPYVAEVRVFDTTLRERINDTSVEIQDPALKDLLGGILVNRTTIKVVDQGSGMSTTYLFIDLRNDRYGSDVSRIIELRYTDAPVRQALSSSILFYLSLGMVALIGCAFLAIISVRSLTRPIGKMVTDVNTIAGGDLDHSLTPPIGKELLSLEESISSMVFRLKSMIAELRTSEENYRTLVQSANSVILRSTPDGKILFMNKFGQEFFGYPEDEIIGRNVFETILPEMSDRVRPVDGKFDEFMTHPDRLLSIENENRTRDGRRVWLAWTNRPLYDSNGNITEILSIGNDISRIKQAEIEVSKLNTELEQRVADRTRQLVEANRNLESFTYSVSHDLRAPLRAISGYSSILLQDLSDVSEKDQKYLELLRQNAHDMGRLIDDLLNFSRLGQHSLQKETVYPGPLVKEILQGLRSDPAFGDVEFRIGDLPPCSADSGLLKQVLTNLISNAVKFSHTQPHPVVEIGSRNHEPQPVYFVRDNGIGFDMRYAGKIFGLFQRLHPAEEYEGTGVGLAIVQRIIEMHGGRIWVESEPEKGTTFYFTCGE